MLMCVKRFLRSFRIRIFDYKMVTRIWSIKEYRQPHSQ